jgi:hypothetical protein
MAVYKRQDNPVVVAHHRAHEAFLASLATVPPGTALMAAQALQVDKLTARQLYAICLLMSAPRCRMS